MPPAVMMQLTIQYVEIAKKFWDAMGFEPVSSTAFYVVKDDIRGQWPEEVKTDSRGRLPQWAARNIWRP